MIGSCLTSQLTARQASTNESMNTPSMARKQTRYSPKFFVAFNGTRSPYVHRTGTSGQPLVPVFSGTGILGHSTIHRIYWAHG